MTLTGPELDNNKLISINNFNNNNKICNNSNYFKFNNLNFKINLPHHQ